MDNQTLFEFITNLKSDLESGAISTQEALVACHQYGYLRDTLNQVNPELVAAAQTSEDNLRTFLLTTIQEVEKNIKELSNFKSQKPDVIAKEEEIKTLATLRTTALERMKKHTQETLKNRAARKESFIHELVARYSSRNPLSANQKQAESVYEKEIQTIKQTQQDVYTAILSQNENNRPDVLVDVVINAPVNEPKTITIIRATKLATVAGLLQKVSKPSFVAGGFFTSDNARGVTRGIQQAADGILSVVGEPFAEIILKNKAEGGLKALLTNTQQLVDRLGESFVSSPLFSTTLQNLTKSLGERPAARGSSIFGDIFTSVFRGPLDHALIAGTKDKFLDFMELARANAAAPAGYKFLPAGIGPWNINFAGRNKKSEQFIPRVGIGSLGTGLGNIAASVVDRSISQLFANPFFGPRVGYSRRAAAVPTPWYTDQPLQLALMVIIGVIVVAALSYASKGYKDITLLTSLFQGGAKITGPVTLSCANTAGAHMWQIDPRWGLNTCSAARPDIQACKPITYCTIGGSGCGSTSAAMILKSFGLDMSVKDVWDEQHSNNGYAYYDNSPFDSCASYWTGPGAVLENHGLSVISLGTHIDEVEKYLKECGLVYAVVHEKWNSGAYTGHIIVITGISTEGGITKVITMDPMRPPGSVSIVKSDEGARNGSAGDIYIRALYAVINNN